jgi:hypothetical protein
MPSTMNASQVKVPAKVQAGLVRFWLTNHWMHAALADTSPVSHYSHRPGSVFFGNFVAGTPFLVDHMLYADEQQLGNMKVRADVFYCRVSLQMCYVHASLIVRFLLSCISHCKL